MNLLWALLILICAVAVAVGAMLLVRRSASEGSYFEDGDRASGVFGVLATGFAIFAGFVIFLASRATTSLGAVRRPRRSRSCSNSRQRSFFPRMSAPA